jgi:hypothetical protein
MPARRRQRGGRRLGHPRASRRAGHSAGAGVRSRPRCRPAPLPATPRRKAATGGRGGAHIGTSEVGQAPGALPGDQRFQSGVDDCGLLAQPGQSPRLIDQLVVEDHGRSHVHHVAILMHIFARLFFGDGWSHGRAQADGLSESHAIRRIDENARKAGIRRRFRRHSCRYPPCRRMRLRLDLQSPRPVRAGRTARP